MSTLYNTIGGNYNLTRKADPFITTKIYELLGPEISAFYLDIGCGTGNYLNALTEKGLSFMGIDPSEIMLKQAKEKNPYTKFIHAQAEHIPLPDQLFNGAIAILTIHHWNSIGQGLKEIKRVLKPNSKLVLFSFTPQQLRGYWLYHYFPIMIENCMKTIVDLTQMEQYIKQAGFSQLQTELYFVQDDLQDQFMYSNKHHPEKYLLEEIRNNASGFRVFSDPDELMQGVAKLKNDIETGKIKAVIKEYENDLGDYIFLTVS